MKNERVLFRQLFDKETSTYTYILADHKTKEALIIDSVKENLNRDLRILKELGLSLKYTLETHIHADHVTASYDLREKTGAKIVLSNDASVECHDIALGDSEKLFLGEVEVIGLKTPGHTKGCMSFLVEGMIFTGDSLLYRGTGRTDFQGGSSQEMFNSIFNKIYTLADSTFIFPGHDYNGHTVSTVGEEKKFNSRISSGVSLEAFKETMGNLNLPKPKRMEIAVPANIRCGQS